MIENKILLLLISASEKPITSYELIRLLSRRFKIDYTKVINECLNDNYIERNDYPSREMGSYKLTEKGETELKKINMVDFELELLMLYPEESDFIKVVFPT